MYRKQTGNNPQRKENTMENTKELNIKKNLLKCSKRQAKADKLKVEVITNRYNRFNSETGEYTDIASYTNEETTIDMDRVKGLIDHIKEQYDYIVNRYGITKETQPALTFINNRKNEAISSMSVLADVIEESNDSDELDMESFLDELEALDPSSVYTKPLEAVEMGDDVEVGESVEAVELDEVSELDLLKAKLNTIMSMGMRYNTLLKIKELETVCEVQTVAIQFGVNPIAPAKRDPVDAYVRNLINERFGKKVCEDDKAVEPVKVSEPVNLKDAVIIKELTDKLNTIMSLGERYNIILKINGLEQITN